MSTTIDVGDCRPPLTEALAIVSIGPRSRTADGAIPGRESSPAVDRARARTGPARRRDPGGGRISTSRWLRTLGRSAMNLLLDTHAFILVDSNRDSCRRFALAALRDPANSVWFSVVNVGRW